MTLIALGLNHHTAPVDIRERAAIGDDRLGDALEALRDVDAVNEAAIVSTCNRTEIYCGVEGDDARPVVDWMHGWMDMHAGHADPYLFQHADLNAVTHLLRVCSGLDSMVLGEPQILGQIKRAYRDATTAGTVGQQLVPLFQHAFSVAKQVRTETAIGTNPVSVAFAAVSLARQIFADFGKHTALLIGAGETVQLAARHLKKAGIGRVLIANRTVERARILAGEVDGEAIPLGAIHERLHEADIVISSTASPLPVLGKGAVGSALKRRRHRSMLFVDIAVPRDIETEVGELDSVFLYTVDDLRSVIDENRQSREAAAVEAEEIVAHQAGRFMRKLQSLGATDTIRDYRAQVDAIRVAQLARAKKQLAAGKSAESVLEQLAHGLSNKLMHTPTARLREAAEFGEFEVIDNARRVLGLTMPRDAP